MAAPLQTGEEVIGIIYVDNGVILRPFSQDDLDLLTVMANVAAVRIENARLAEIEQSEKLMEADLSQASEIQRSLLPTEPPAYDGWELAGLNLPCRTVGGDYFDFIPYQDGRLAVVVGDVSGRVCRPRCSCRACRRRCRCCAKQSVARPSRRHAESKPYGALPARQVHHFLLRATRPCIWARGIQQRGPQLSTDLAQQRQR